jgi:DedD protein
MALEERLKQRLLGGAVLVAIVVIFVPMLIDEPLDSRVVSDHQMPSKPESVEIPMPSILPPPPADTPAPTPVLPVADEGSKAARTASEPEPKPKPKPVPEQQSKPSPSAWMIQVASLTVKENAEKLVADLRQAEMPAMLERVEVEGKRHYRVRVGPEVSHKTAMSMAERIKRDFKLTPKVMRYPD